MSYTADEIRTMAARVGVTNLDDAALARLHGLTEAMAETIARVPRWRAKEIEPAAIFTLPGAR